MTITPSSDWENQEGIGCNKHPAYATWLPYAQLSPDLAGEWDQSRFPNNTWTPG